MSEKSTISKLSAVKDPSEPASKNIADREKELAKFIANLLLKKLDDINEQKSHPLSSLQR